MLATGTVYMGGYGIWTSRGAATGIHDPLRVQAMCLEAGQALCVAVVDSLGLPTPVLSAIQEQVAESTGLPGEHLLIAATHTHAAPDLLGLWGGSPDSYQEMLITNTANAIQNAWQNRQTATLVYTVTQAPSRNRRSWPPDDRMVVLQATGEAGQPIATLVNFAAHPVVTPMSNLLLSSDYVHGFRKLAQAETGAPVLFVNGALGDASPAAPPGDSRFERAERYGELLAAHAMDALKTAQPVKPVLTIRATEVNLTLDNRILRFAHWLGLLNEPMEGRLIAAPVAHLTLGNSVSAITLPGEPLTVLGRRLRAELDSEAAMVFGLTGG